MSWVYSNLVLIGWVCGLILVVSLIYRWYQQPQIQTKQRIPWFDPPPEKLVYEQLVSKHSSSPSSASSSTQADDPVTTKQLAAALVRRAIADVRILSQMSQERNSLHALVKSGAIGEDMWESFLAAEHDMQDELQEVLDEADTFKAGWSSTILAEAQQICQQQMHKAADVALKAQMMELEAGRKEREQVEAAEREAERMERLKELLDDEDKEKARGAKMRAGKARK
ncbi:hypothetical protein SeLEV6574_g06590 [Synchytrium endobioticum]|nr:hypothetical protein SeLEV6574_g06590 [Synchytrium endobioticum]